MKNNDILKVYNKFVINKFINYDTKQEKLLSEIYKTWYNNKKINFFSSKSSFNGIYVYGSVGIGKTFILNLFTQNIDRGEKIHFNHFMFLIHPSAYLQIHSGFSRSLNEPYLG